MDRETKRKQNISRRVQALYRERPRKENVAKFKRRDEELSQQLSQLKKRYKKLDTNLQEAYEPLYEPPAIFKPLIGGKLKLDPRDVTRKGLVKNVMDYMQPPLISDEDRQNQAWAEFTNQSHSLTHEIDRLKRVQRERELSRSSDLRRELLQYLPNSYQNVDGMFELRAANFVNRRRMSNQVQKIRYPDLNRKKSRISRKDFDVNAYLDERYLQQFQDPSSRVALDSLDASTGSMQQVYGPTNYLDRLSL